MAEKNCNNTAADEATLRGYVNSANVYYPANTWSTLSTPDDSQWVLPQWYNEMSETFRDQVHFKLDQCPSPDTDGLMAVFQPDGWVLDTYATVVLSDGDIVSNAVATLIDAKADGTGWWNGRRASMLPSFAGLIRTGEIANGVIPHALSVTISPTMLKEEAVWPAYAFDRNSGYSGTLPMGALLAIPDTVNIDSLGLTETGKIVARAAQDYGVYVTDRGGANGITFMAELNNPEIRWNGWQADIEKIADQLQRVSNNSENNKGGGGTLRAPLAPPFADEVDTEVPTVPSNVTATAVSGTAVSVSWTASTDNVGVTAYTVYRDGVSVGTVNGTSYTDETVSPSTSYVYTVAATDAAGNSSVQSTAAQVATPSVNATPKIATLTDEFTGNTIDASTWWKYEGYGYSVYQAEDMLQFSSWAEYNYATLASVHTYDVTDSSYTFNLVDPGFTTWNPTAYFWVKLESDKDNAIEIGLNNNTLYAKVFENGVGMIRQSVVYNNAAMRWLRMRESGGVVYWEYAADAHGPWTVLYQGGIMVTLNEVTAVMGAGAWPGYIGAIKVDNVNVLPEPSTELEPQTSEPTPVFERGVQVEALGDTGVYRRTRDSNPRCTQAAGVVGDIDRGPTVSSGNTWWRVNFSSGCDGWVKENELRIR